MSSQPHAPAALAQRKIRHETYYKKTALDSVEKPLPLPRIDPQFLCHLVPDLSRFLSIIEIDHNLRWM